MFFSNCRSVQSGFLLSLILSSPLFLISSNVTNIDCAGTNLPSLLRICGSMGPNLDCLDIIISSPDMMKIVPALIAIFKTMKLTFSNLGRSALTKLFT